MRQASVSLPKTIYQEMLYGRLAGLDSLPASIATLILYFLDMGDGRIRGADAQNADFKGNLNPRDVVVVVVVGV